MIPKAIHQFHSGSAFGDAVTNGMLYTKRILQELGFESKIYVEHVAPALENEIEHFSKYVSDENNILFLHHSMGHDLDEWIKELSDKIVLVYHNITPETFFEKDSVFYNYSLKGRRQLELLREKSIASIGDSQLNVDELLSRGFDKDNSKVIPLLLDVDKIKSHDWSYDLYDSNSDTFNIVFIGRVAENKCQHEVIEIYNRFREKTNLKTKCFIVGGLSNDSYESNLYELIDRYGIADEVIITDKVSSEDLYSYYRLADVFLCMSEHEGFGVPLVESMVFDVPVIAYDSSNIKNTLNGGGILINEKDFNLISNIIYKLSINRVYRREIIYKQREAVKIYENNYIKSELVNFLKSLGVEINYNIKSNSDIDRIKYQFEGPFDSSYSLAILNREMASSMNRKYTGAVSLFSTEGGGDFKPNQEFIKDMEDVISMSEKSKKALRSDVLLRNLYPPRVNDMRGLINLMNSYGWEESSFPKEYIDNFNKHLDALPVMSKYVQKVMKDNGLVIPAPVVGVGIDHILDIKSKEYGLKSKKNFKFLHISSCFPRKGVDVLLEAYCSSFTNEDDVCLVIKTFPNPHNDIEEQISKKQIENDKCPEIELINVDLEDGYIVGLYESCDCLVAPSRGEGFGMPMAEAMLFNMPVITTGYSGQVDFCTDETAWLIDYTFEKTQTHMGLFNSYWANPKVEHLSTLMKNMINIPLDEKLKKITKAKQNILENHKWEDCTNRLNNIVKDIQHKNSEEQKVNPKIGWVTTWNSKCGIATYSKFLIDEFSNEVDIKIFANILPQSQLIDSLQESKVQRVWKDAGETDLNNLFNAIVDSKIDTLVIQFNFGFFNLYALENLIKKLDERNIKIIIEFHSVADVDKENFKASLGWIKDSLSKIEKLLVHNIDDLNILKTFGLVENVTLFPHGVMESTIDDKIIFNKKRELCLENKFVIASYGFLLPQKGIKELIEAFSIINKNNRNTHLLLVNAIYPVDESIIYEKECNELIKELNLEDNILMINEFLSDDESLKYLQCSDLIVMPYKETKESASGAARYALSSKKPLLCTPQYIFKDIEDLVHFTKDDKVSSLVDSILKLIDDRNLLTLKFDYQNKWIKDHSWLNMANRMSILLEISNGIKKRTKKQFINSIPKNKPVIYFDCTSTIRSNLKTGVQRVVRELINQKEVFEKVTGLIFQPICHQYNWYYKLEDALKMTENTENNYERIEPTYNDIYFCADSYWSYDIVNWLAYFKNLGTKIITVCYDLIPINHRNYFSLEETTNFEKATIDIIQYSDLILCISNSTQVELINYIRNNKINNSAKITNFKLANSTFAKEVNNKFDNKYKNKNYMLMVGTIEPRKEYFRTILEFEKLWELGSKIELCIVGKKGSDYNEFYDKFDELSKKYPIYIYSGIEDDELGSLYKNAIAVIVSSSAEGYGLPLSEAIQYNKPVYANRLKVFGEFAGSYPIYFEINKKGDLFSKLSNHKDNFWFESTLNMPTWSQSAEEISKYMVEEFSLNRIKINSNDLTKESIQWAYKLYFNKDVDEDTINMWLGRCKNLDELIDNLRYIKINSNDLTKESIQWAYKLYFNKDVDEDTINMWLGRCKNLDELIDNLRYIKINSNDLTKESIQWAYKLYFNKDVDEDTINMWLGRCKNLDELIDNLRYIKINSNDLTKESIQWAYKLYFNKDVDEDTINMWLGRCKNLDELIDNLRYIKINSNDLTKESIQWAYKLYFNKDVDEGGLNYWLEQNDFNKMIANFIYELKKENV